MTEKRITRNNLRRKGARIATLCMATLLAAMFSCTAYAAKASIVVDNQTGDDSIEVEAAVGGMQYILASDNGFSRNIEADEGSTSVDAIVRDDVYGYYKLDFEPTVDLKDDTIIRITVSYSDNFGDAGEDDAPDLNTGETLLSWDNEPLDVGVPNVPMEEIDLSGDAHDTGWLIVSCQNVNAFDEIVLTLLDANYTAYNVPLHWDYGFRARVRLPIGQYRETGTPKITFNEYASPDDRFSYVWEHTGGASFGGFVDIETDKETTLQELAVMTISDGQTVVTDSRYYGSKKQYEENSKAAEITYKEFQEKNYEDLPPAMLPDAEPTDDHFDLLGTILSVLKTAAPWAVLAIIVALAVVGVKKIRKMYHDNNRMY